MAIDTKLNLSNSKFEQASGDTLTLSGVTIIEGSLIFASGYTPTGNTSVATKLYVDQNTTGSSLTFNNGLTETGGTVSLGGTLTGDTVINTNDNGFAIGTYSYALGNNSVAIGGYAYTTTGGTNSVALASGAAQGRVSFGVSYGIACACGAFSHGRSASGCYSVGLASGIAIGNHSLAVGDRVESSGNYSVAIGGNNQSLRNVRACGTSSKNISSLCSAIDNIGALGNYSSIFGGVNNNISTGNTNATIVGGNTIDLTGTTYIDSTVLGGNVAIFDLPSNGTSGDTVLVRDSSTGIIKEIAQSGLTGGGGSSYTFNNGLTDNGGTVSLGGALTGNTIISTNSHGVVIGCGNASGVNQGYGGNNLSVGNAYAYGEYSLAVNNGRSYGDYSVALNSGRARVNNSVAMGGRTEACGYYSLAIGRNTETRAPYTFTGGKGYYSPYCTVQVYARGYSSFNFSSNNSSSVACTNGSNANYSAILGGENHNIASGNTRAAIIGGYDINLTGTTYVDTTAMSNLAIMSTPSAGTSGDTVLVRDSSTGIIKEIAQSSIGGGSGASVAGNDTEIQFNDGGSSLGAFSGFTFNQTTKTLDVEGEIAISGTSVLRFGYSNASVELGINSSATANNATAIGSNSIANQITSTAVGALSCATALSSSAFGYRACAFGQNSTSLGIESVTSGFGGVAIGYDSKGTGGRATVVGSQSVASGNYSLALGTYASATTDSSISIGRVASSNNIRAVAIGYNSEVTSIDGIALGSNAATCNTSSVSIGTNASSDGSESIAIGRNSTTCGSSSVAVGNLTQATGTCSSALGSFAKANGARSVAIGNGTAIGNDSLAIGTGLDPAITNNGNSIALLGYTYNYNTIAIGGCARSFGNRGVAIGYKNIASGNCATVIGGSYNINCAANSVLLGGVNQNITSSSFDNHTIVENLAIVQSPSAGASGDTVLVRDSEGIVKGVAQTGVTGGFTYLGGTLTTTTNAIQTIRSFALADNTVYVFEYFVSGRRTDTANRAGYIRRAVIYRQAGGTATIQGTINNELTIESNTNWDATITVSGNNVLFRVQGATGATINWNANIKYTSVS